MEIKKCKKCGAMVEVLKPCTCANCGIKCCGEQMQTLHFGESDGAVEKHLPKINIKKDEIEVVVPHVMEEGHYIEWIALESDGLLIKKTLKVGQEAKVIFPKIEKGNVYSYCNKHGIWKAEI